MLETGDLALAAMPEGAVVERKTPSDLVACMTSARERFERELLRSRYLGRFVVVVGGSLPDVLASRRQMSEASVIGTLAAWQRRYAGFSSPEASR
jgi:ERCC4-type nuclease